MNNGNNAAQGKHLESIAAATKRYILAQILDVTDAVSSELENFSGAGVLDTVPATVDGGLWLELENDLPSVIKLKHGAHTLTLTPTIINVSPGLTVTPSASTIPADGSITAAVSYLGTGAITVSGTNGVTPSYDSSTKIITVPYSYDADSSTITVSLAAAYGYLADSTTFNVSMEKTSPNLTVTPLSTSNTDDDITASVSYLGNGTISVSSDNANVVPTYDSSTGIITCPYYPFPVHTEITITVNLTSTSNFYAASTTFTYTNPWDVHTRAWLRFDRSPTYDSRGLSDSWTAVGSPTVSNGTLYLDGASAITRSGITLGGKNFSIEFRANIQSTDDDAYIFEIAKEYGTVCFLDKSSFNSLEIVCGSEAMGGLTLPSDWANYEVFYDHNAQTLTLYINNIQIHQLTSVSIGRNSCTVYLGKDRYSNAYFKGYIDNFMIIEGSALTPEY